MASLSSHANVWETCLQILERRGYRVVRTMPEEDDESPGAFEAERDGFSFAADNPIELLGLVGVYEEVGPTEDYPYWWSTKTDGSRVWDRLENEALAREEARNAELEKLQVSDRSAWEAEVRRAFENGYDQTNAASFLGVTRAELRRIVLDPELADLAARPKKPGS